MGGSSDLAHVLLVGDVHRAWREADRRYVEAADASVCVFVGDLGDEDVGMVEAIAATEAPILVMLGNHDAWASFSRRKSTTALHRSLEILGDRHLGYTRRELPEAGVTIIGARPFSWGGPSLRSPELYSALYDVSTMEESAERIVALADQAEHDDLLVIAHNGPAGLSTDPQDIWGKDFGKIGSVADWGDRDLELALAEIRRRGKRVVAVVAGHMHDRLKRPVGGRRTRFVRRAGTTFVNPAVVPRRANRDGVEAGYFARLSFDCGRLVSVDEVWAGPDADAVAEWSARVLDIDADTSVAGDGRKSRGSGD